MICFASAAILVALLAQMKDPTEVDGHPETRVSESRKYGKYVRTEEVFQEQMLLSQKREVSVQDDGKVDVVFTKLFRGGEMIYTSSHYITEKRTIRGYYHQGKLTVQEGDEDGDGSFETMILFGANELPVEAFSKNKDGTVTQFSKEKLATIKKSFARFQEE